MVQSLERWERAGRLRAFCNAARHEIEKLPDVERRHTEVWLFWATAHAKALDPLGDRLMDVTEVNVNLDGWYPSEYQQPQPDWSTQPLRKQS